MMHPPLVSKRRAQAIFTALFFIGLAIISYMDIWWPGIMLAVGIPLALRQYLLGRLYDMGITLLVFVGAFVTAQFDISWKVLLPFLFAVGAFYVFMKEFVYPGEEPEDEKEEDLNHEIEEKRRK